MSYIGKTTELTIDRFTSVGAFLTDNQEFEVLLPNRYVTDNMALEDVVEVFIYNDSEDRPVATTETPKIHLDEFAYLQVKDVTPIGAFLDWGLAKDLLVPFKEQGAKMEEGKTYLVYLFLDEVTNRLVASAKINKFLGKLENDLENGDKVELFIADKTELGQNVIVNNKFNGLIFNDRIVKPIERGERIEGYVEFIRQDGKIDISVVPVGTEKFDKLSEQLLQYIQANDGKIFLTDKSDPELIRSELGMSKKSFKKAVGNLYKAKKIKLEADFIALKS